MHKKRPDVLKKAYIRNKKSRAHPLASVPLFSLENERSVQRCSVSSLDWHTFTRQFAKLAFLIPSIDAQNSSEHFFCRQVWSMAFYGLESKETRNYALAVEIKAQPAKGYCLVFIFNFPC